MVGAESETRPREGKGDTKASLLDSKRCRTTPEVPRAWAEVLRNLAEDIRSGGEICREQG